MQISVKHSVVSVHLPNSALLLSYPLLMLGTRAGGLVLKAPLVSPYALSSAGFEKMWVESCEPNAFWLASGYIDSQTNLCIS
jgi:hypothetical protein